MVAGPVRIAILANGAQARTEMTRTGAAMSRLGGFAKAGILAAGVGLVAMGKSAITAEAEFSTSMRLIQAATKAPAADMQKLNDLAIKLGAETSFSAKDAADAMLELAKAGLSTKTIMGGGVAGTLTLAAAGGTDLATAATIASNALNTFNLQGKDMAKVAAALAGGANASSASVESLGQGLQQVGPGATNAGLSLQETVAVLSAFDAAGIKGSDAGTSLKTMLTRLVPQTDRAQAAMEGLHLDFTKADGSMVSISNAAQQLRTHMGKLSDEERTTAMNTIFGSDATRAATVLMKEGAEGVREFTKATNDQGAAQKMADARMGGTAGALEALSGSIETAQLRLGQELAPAVEASANFLAMKLVPAMDSAIDVTKSIGSELKPVVSALGVLGSLAKDAAGFIGDLPEPIKSIGIQAGIAALILPRLTTAVGSASTAVTGQIAKMKQLRAEMTYAETRTQRLTTLTSGLGGAARTAAGVGGMVALTQGVGKADTALGALETTAGAAALGFSMGGPWGAAIGGAAGGLFSLFKIIDKNHDGMSRSTTQANEYAASIDRIAQASGRAQRAEALTMLQQEKGLIPTANALGIATSDLISGLLGSEKAMKRVNSTFRANGRLSVAQGVEIQTVTRFLRDQGFALSQHQNALRDEQRALKGTDREFAKVPRSVQRLNASLRNVGDTRSGMGKFTAFFRGDLDKVRSDADERSRRINALLLSNTSKARPNLAPFRSDILSQLNAAESTARTGGQGVGAALSQGVAAGIVSNANAAVNAAAAVVADAIAASRRQAHAHSPSRKMMSLGKDMADGLAIGMTGGSARSLLEVKNTRGAGSGSTSSFPRELTLVVDGQPMRAHIRREISKDRKYHDRLDDRD